MTRLLYKGAIEEVNQLHAIEARLQAAFFPVPMRAGFPQELKQKLLKENDLELELERPRRGLVQTVFLPVAGLVSGVLLIALGVRGLIALVNSIACFQHVKNEMAQKKTAPAQPVV